MATAQNTAPNWEHPKLARSARRWLFILGLYETVSDKAWDIGAGQENTETLAQKIGKAIAYVPLATTATVLAVADMAGERRFIRSAEANLGATVPYERDDGIISIEGSTVCAYWAAEMAVGAVSANNPLPRQFAENPLQTS